ncbi:MAG: UDP-3-O-[3-hydroxymyristoyl] N-acetylglucosamine deacetylase [Labilithrix sp.]|nr:UDP-3-O-[3-hydroxymyristoyl] N-acetylglucosamine deacetylase [Labilithrix sp.]
MWIEGHGLHGGAPARVRFVREPGAVRLRTGGREARIAELQVHGATRSTAVATADGRLRLRTVEHLFAALASMSIHEGLVAEIDGPEVPLADGGCLAFIEALGSLALEASPPKLRVMRAGTIDIGRSRYELRPPQANEVRIEVEVDFDDVRLERHARWAGEPADFRLRIASARTFGFEHEIGDLLARGLASHVSPESVVVVARESILSAGRPFRADEPARHKLLDLVGDLYLHGGPPLGTVRAIRPGHAATHEAMVRGLADGLLMVTRTR